MVYELKIALKTIGRKDLAHYLESFSSISASYSRPFGSSDCGFREVILPRKLWISVSKLLAD